MSNSKINHKPIIGITIGDYNGVGPEVIIKALEDNRLLRMITPIIYGSAKVLSFYKKLYNINGFNYVQLSDASQVNNKKINVINCWNETVNITPGQESDEAGAYAFKALEQATSDLKDGFIDGIVTGPVNKSKIPQDHEPFNGHTEYFANKFKVDDVVMLLAGERFRVAQLTGHIPLSTVSQNITAENISAKLKTLLKSLKKDFCIAKPKIAVLGLNPHAGEGGLLGKEEIDIITPALEEFKAKNQLVFGPFPADGFFGSGQQLKYDAVLAMYHDQGLIPFKALEFEKGVNVTLGLPSIRTSPCHGTAYGIAGKNVSSGDSMREAILMVKQLLKNKKEAVAETSV